MLKKKLLEALLEPINESLTLLHSIETKLDAQAESKLRGAMGSLKTLATTARADTTTLQILLISFTESTEYFQLVMKQSGRNIFDLTGTNFKGFKFGLKTWRDVYGLKGGSFHHLLVLLSEWFNFYNLFILSQVGGIACMYELGYKNADLLERLDTLKRPMNLPSLNDIHWIIVWASIKGLFTDAPPEAQSYFARICNKFSKSDRLAYKIIRLDKTLLQRLTVSVLRYCGLQKVIIDSENVKDLLSVIPDHSNYEYVLDYLSINF